MLSFFHKAHERRKYSKIAIPPMAAVTMEKTVLADMRPSLWTVYYRPKYNPIGIKTLSIITKVQKNHSLRFFERRS